MAQRIGLQYIPGGLVADGKQEALLATFLKAVARDAAGGPQTGQRVLLTLLLSVVALLVDFRQLLVEFGRAALKLPQFHLQQDAVGMVVTDAVKQYLGSAMP